MIHELPPGRLRRRYFLRRLYAQGRSDWILDRDVHGSSRTAGINIATFHLGRDNAGGNAIALVEVDGMVPADVLAQVLEIPNVQQVKPLRF